MMRELFHVALPGEWRRARAEGRYFVSTRGRMLHEEGFIHCSFAEQVAGVIERFYADLEQIVLIRIDPHRLHVPMVVEDLDDIGEAFPHVYGPIPVDAVIDARVVDTASVRGERD